MTNQVAETRNYFDDASVLQDPVGYFNSALALDPIYPVPDRDYVLVTGYEECVEVLRNTEDFSSIFSFSPYGAGAPLPFEPIGDDISAQIERQRTPSDLLVTYDGLSHAQNRSILNRLFTPARLRNNERFMRQRADEMLVAFAARGGGELISDFALPFATQVISDLLGVPEEDRELFMAAIAASPRAGEVHPGDVRTQVPHFEYMEHFFSRYIAERRLNPGADVLNELAAAQYPDGSTPDLLEIVKLAMFLFVGGRGSSSKFLASCVLPIAVQPDLQRRLRENRELIRDYLEEVARLHGTTKATFRLARRTTRIGDQVVPAGTKLVVAMMAANRDPRRWKNPEAFEIDRPRIREHLAFGRGPHVCAGAPLARAEGRVVLETLFNRCSDIRLDQDHHGDSGDRSLQYESSYIVRGLKALHLRLTS